MNPKILILILQALLIMAVAFCVFNYVVGLPEVKAFVASLSTKGITGWWIYKKYKKIKGERHD
jgi:positive regulator of sigma E activity